MFALKLVLVLVASAVAAPRGQGAPLTSQGAPATSPALGVVPLEKTATVVPILAQSEELESNGTYKFSYETGNGIKREETAYDKVLPKAEGRSADSGEVNDTSNEIHVQQGSYSYTAPDGTLISVRYIADENGFQPTGDHLPTPPPLSVSASNGEKSGRALNAESSVPALTGRSSQGVTEADAKKVEAPTAKTLNASTTDAPTEASTSETINSSTTDEPTQVTTTEASSSTTDKPIEATTEAAKTEAAKAISAEKSTVAPEASTTEVASTTAL